MTQNRTPPEKRRVLKEWIAGEHILEASFANGFVRLAALLSA
jgi:hypothetical protein